MRGEHGVILTCDLGVAGITPTPVGNKLYEKNKSLKHPRLRGE